MSVSLLLFWVTLAFLLLAPLVVLYSSVAALVCPTHHRGGAFWVALSNRGWGEVFMAYRFTPDTREFCLFLFAVAAASIPAAFKRASDSSHGLCQGAVCDNAYTHWKKKKHIEIHIKPETLSVRAEKMSSCLYTAFFLKPQIHYNPS